MLYPSRLAADLKSERRSAENESIQTTIHVTIMIAISDSVIMITINDNDTAPGGGSAKVIMITISDNESIRSERKDKEQRK